MLGLRVQGLGFRVQGSLDFGEAVQKSMQGLQGLGA